MPSLPSAFHPSLSSCRCESDPLAICEFRPKAKNIYSTLVEKNKMQAGGGEKEKEKEKAAAQEAPTGA